MKRKTQFSLFIVYGVFSLFILGKTVSIANAATLQNQKAIDTFYLSRGGDPLWFNNTRLNRAGKDVLDVLEKSWMNGLNPKQYHAQQIRELFGFGRRLDEDETLLAEILLTDGYIHYLRDVSGMRIDARDMELNSKHWRQQMSAEEALSYLSVNVSTIHDMKAFMLLQEPQSATYQMLKATLVELVENRANNPDAYKATRLSFDALVRPGLGYNDIPKLRLRLGVDDVATERYIYDPELVNAVMQFQASEGLKVDGLIGSQTLYVLNQTSQDKIRQIIANMERLRWAPDEKPSRFIVVNIPSATLWAVDDGAVRFEMPVVVGRKKRQTNSFVTQIHGVRFNPTWTVPPTIKEEDILPELIKDPTYLADKGMELYDGYAKDAPTIDPSVIDWASVTEDELKTLRMVQIPGEQNPLGFVRILMPNEHNIYLHDTNHREMFARTNRAKSSGCIRLQAPEKVAAFVLESRKGWTTDKMRQILDKKKLRDIYTSERMAVYVLYYTVWLGNERQIVYGTDLYGRDKKLLQLLEKLDGLPVLGEYDNNVVNIVQK
ncbi:MAG: murein L,D-transpeptidase [Alphaproteobacteria bacterium]|nr:MAG: murein L,D-transpeptidase [Alphaproteobacteria bacterium]